MRLWTDYNDGDCQPSTLLTSQLPRVVTGGVCSIHSVHVSENFLISVTVPSYLNSNDSAMSTVEKAVEGGGVHRKWTPVVSGTKSEIKTKSVYGSSKNSKKKFQKYFLIVAQG